jgi:hypothetical protein
MMQKDGRARLWNQARLRDLKRASASDVTITSSHDVFEFERLAKRRSVEPADRRERPPGHDTVSASR